MVNLINGVSVDPCGGPYPYCSDSNAMKVGIFATPMLSLGVVHSGIPKIDGVHTK